MPSFADALTPARVICTANIVYAQAVDPRAAFSTICGFNYKSMSLISDEISGQDLLSTALAKFCPGTQPTREEARPS